MDFLEWALAIAFLAYATRRSYKRYPEEITTVRDLKVLWYKLKCSLRRD